MLKRDVKLQLTDSLCLRSNDEMGVIAADIPFSSFYKFLFEFDECRNRQTREYVQLLRSIYLFTYLYYDV